MTQRPRLQGLRGPLTRSATATAAALACVAVITTGCPTHLCDPSWINLGAPGAWVGDSVPSSDGSLTWESGPQVPPPGATWLDFPGGRTYYFTLAPPFSDKIPFQVQAFLSSGPNPQTNFISGTGQLAEFFTNYVDGGAKGDIGPIGHIGVTNQSCSEYFLRVVASFPAPVASAVADGGVGDAVARGFIEGGVLQDASADQTTGD
ncbi:MAG: hypothetical protein ACREJ3_15270 [Polyangiaceae bacterium]